MRANVIKGRPSENPRNVGLLPNNILILIFLMLPTVYFVPQVRCTNVSPHVKGSSCCSFPCKNGGSCTETFKGYVCNCTGTNHYGRNCEIEQLGHWLKKHICAGAVRLGLSVCVTDLHLVMYKPQFSKEQLQEFCNANFNVCTPPMLLSPVPEHCPTPLGIAGFQILPPTETLYDLVLKRRCPIEHTTSPANLLFVVFAQFLANQMWECTNSNWIGSSSMYGSFVRTGLSGKVFNHYNGPKGNIYQNAFTDAFQNIILHEHNRVCDILSHENPKWNDHRLFETATLVVTGEILKIASAEWLPLLHDFRGHNNWKSPYPYIVSNKVPKEMKLALLWPQMFPDRVCIEGSSVDLGILMSQRERALPHGGHYQLLKFAATVAPGKMGPQNAPAGLEEVTKFLIMEGRKWKFQSFNNYREYLGLQRLSSFTKLTNNNIVTKNLEKIYRDVNGLELIPGLLLETPKKGKLFGETTDALIINMIFKAVVSHPLNTVPLKKKFTFGGKTGWTIVKNAKLRCLICNNVHDKRLCDKEGLISFKRGALDRLPITSAASCAKAGKSKRSTCRKNRVKTTGSVKKCQPLTPVKQVCALKTTAAPMPHLPQKASCATAAGQCHPQTLQAPLRPETCTTGAETRETTCPQQAKKCCMKRPWFATITKIYAKKAKPGFQESQCAQKPTPDPTCAPKNTGNSKVEPKTESFCKSPAATLGKADINAATCPQVKKCCVKRHWFKAITDKVTQKPGLKKCTGAQKLYQKPACPQKNAEVSAVEPKSDRPCRTNSAGQAQLGKKCCVKRSWFKAWKG